MVRIGLYLEPDTRKEWLVLRVRTTPLLRAFHLASYAAFRIPIPILGAWLPQPAYDTVMDILRSGCWIKPGWLNQAELRRTIYNGSPAPVRVLILALGWLNR